MTTVTIKETAKGKKFTVTVNGKEFTRNTKNDYTHAMFVQIPETEWNYQHEKMTFHRSKDLAEKAQKQYPAGTRFQIIELQEATEATQKPAQEVTFGKKQHGFIEASNGYKILCKVFPVEKYIVKKDRQEVETFPTLQKAKKFVKSL